MTSPLRKAVIWSRLPWNTLMFSVRRRLRWQRGEPELEQEPKDDLFDYLPASERPIAEARELQLRARYGLQPLADRSSRIVYRDNLWLIDVLDAWLGDANWSDTTTDPVRVADVGAGAFAYAFGLSRVLARLLAAPVGRLTGIELDGYGIYRDGHARVDWARAYARQASDPWQVDYEVGDFRADRGERVDCITMCYPFVRRYPLVAWGLPLSVFDPERMFDSAARLLAPGRRCLVLTQTNEEADRVVELATHNKQFVLLDSTRLHSRLVSNWPATEDRMGIALVRESGSNWKTARTTSGF